MEKAPIQKPGNAATGAKAPEEPEHSEVSIGRQSSVCLRLGLKLIRIVRGSVILYVALSITENGLRLAGGQVFAHITNVLHDGLSAAGSLSGAYVLWVGVAVAAIIVPFFLKHTSASLDGRMANDLRDNLFRRVLAHSPEFFHRNDPGRLTSVLNQMSIETQITIRQLLVDPAIQMFNFVLSAGFIVWNLLQVQQDGPNPWMWVGVVVVLCFALLSPWMVARLSGRLQASSAALREQSLAIAGLVNGALQSPEEIQAMRAEEMIAAKHRTFLDHLLSARLRQTLMVQMLNSLDDIPLLAVQASLVGFAIFGGLSGAHANPSLAGAVVAILLQAPQIMAPIQACAGYITMLRVSWPSVETVTSILDSVPRTQDSPTARQIDNVSPEFRVENVKFSYAAGLPPVFNDLSFELPPGKITALVGRMGEGKTTLFRLALRFYDLNGGKIEIGGHPPSAFTLESLRRHAVMMSQFPAWFHDTLRENMRIAKANATDEEIRAVCEQTGMWQVLENRVGSDPLDRQFAGGRMLSGGQKKLLALSRCLLRNPTFLFLDEPTAGMDNREKYRLVEQIRLACDEKTVIMVDHDIPWLMKICDHFIVLNEGRVVQQGGLTELLREEGLFRELAMLPTAPLMPLLSLLRTEGILSELLQAQDESAASEAALKMDAEETMGGEDLPPLRSAPVPGR
jgi:ATP-binding cassette, subfamily B, bacterial